MRRSRLFLGGVVTLMALAATAVSVAVANAATTSYEAESSANTLAGGARVGTCSGCSGGHKVRFVGNGGTLQFNGVTASAAGSATVTITYLTGTARSASLSVNGGSA